MELDLAELIQHPERLDKNTLFELRSLLAVYPYYQTARLLMLQNLYLLHDISFDVEEGEMVGVVPALVPDIGVMGVAMGGDATGVGARTAGTLAGVITGVAGAGVSQASGTHWLATSSTLAIVSQSSLQVSKSVAPRKSRFPTSDPHATTASESSSERASSAPRRPGARAPP